MTASTIDLGPALDVGDAELARIGSAIAGLATLPHPSLQLLERRYPTEVSRARFMAMWPQDDPGSPDALRMGRRFREELLSALRSKQHLQGQWTVLLVEAPDSR